MFSSVIPPQNNTEGKDKAPSTEQTQFVVCSIVQASGHLNIEPKVPTLGALNSETEIQIPNPISKSAVFYVPSSVITALSIWHLKPRETVLLHNVFLRLHFYFVRKVLGPLN